MDPYCADRNADNRNFMATRRDDSATFILRGKKRPDDCTYEDNSRAGSSFSITIRAFRVKGWIIPHGGCVLIAIRAKPWPFHSRAAARWT